MLGKSACEVACEVAGWAGLGLVLGNGLGLMHGKRCSGCSYQEVLGKSSSNNTTAHHHMEPIVVSMGQLKKSVVNYQSRDVAIPPDQIFILFVFIHSYFLLVRPPHLPLPTLSSSTFSSLPSCANKRPHCQSICLFSIACHVPHAAVGVAPAVFGSIGISIHISLIRIRESDAQYQVAMLKTQEHQQKHSSVVNHIVKNSLADTEVCVCVHVHVHVPWACGCCKLWLKPCSQHLVDGSTPHVSAYVAHGSGYQYLAFKVYMFGQTRKGWVFSGSTQHLCAASCTELVCLTVYTKSISLTSPEYWDQAGGEGDMVDTTQSSPIRTSDSNPMKGPRAL